MVGSCPPIGNRSIEHVYYVKGTTYKSSFPLYDAYECRNSNQAILID